MTTLHYNPLLCHRLWYVQSISGDFAPVREWIYDKPVPASVVLKRAKDEKIPKPIVFPGLNMDGWEDYMEALHNAANAVARRMVADVVNIPRN